LLCINATPPAPSPVPDNVAPKADEAKETTLNVV
jgi:hypothetical protein